MKNVIKTLSTLFIVLSAINVNAATVNGALVVGGQYINTASDITLSTVWANGATGDIDGTVDIFTPAGTGGTASLVAFAPVNNFFSVGGWTLDLTSLAIIDNGDILDLAGAGVLSGHGFDSTNVTWSFSAESATSYSMTVTAVPVPAAAWLFGSGLIGLISVARRKA